jgi:hypothetical protein
LSSTKSRSSSWEILCAIPFPTYRVNQTKRQKKYDDQKQRVVILGPRDDNGDSSGSGYCSDSRDTRDSSDSSDPTDGDDVDGGKIIMMMVVIRVTRTMMVVFMNECKDAHKWR